MLVLCSLQIGEPPELLNGEIFYTLKAAELLIERWRGLAWQPLGFAGAYRADYWIRPVFRSLGHLDLRAQSREFNERRLAGYQVGRLAIDYFQ